ncbi:hypothetical protein BDZ89DRAFT_1147039 [Hymenopellis radicata]|nr:hypothetical protein BDZ89DRAFT_1147039 [Hymenopellis radicata]
MKKRKKFPVYLAVMTGSSYSLGGAGALAYLTFGSDIKTVVLVNLDMSKPMCKGFAILAHGRMKTSSKNGEAAWNGQVWRGRGRSDGVRREHGQWVPLACWDVDEDLRQAKHFFIRSSYQKDYILDQIDFHSLNSFRQGKIRELQHAALSLVMDSDMEVQALPEFNKNAIEEAFSDDADTIAQTLASCLRAPSYDAQPSNPFTIPSVSATGVDLRPLVELRFQHQTRCAATGTRTVKEACSWSQALRFRRRLLRPFDPMAFVFPPAPQSYYPRSIVIKVFQSPPPPPSSRPYDDILAIISFSAVHIPPGAGIDNSK